MKVWQQYPALTRAIKATHDEKSSEFGVQMFWCHDFNHVIRVANMAQMIADDERIGQLAGVAALCHNADRILQIMQGKKARDKVDDKPIIEMVNDWLDTEGNKFSGFERGLIIDAVLHHDQPNGEDDSDVLITLIDADRVVNLEADVIVRCGQYMGDALRVLDPVHFVSDPTANFKNPKSILRILWENVRDWEVEGGFVGIRLRRARQFAKPRFAFLRYFLNTVEEQQGEMGMIPYPNFDKASAPTALTGKS